MRPVIKHKRVELEKMSPAYFKKLFSLMPKDATLSCPSVDGKQLIHSISKPLEFLSEYTGALEAFIGLIPSKNECEATDILHEYLDDPSKGASMIDRIIVFCERLEALYDINSKLAYGHFFLIHEAEKRRFWGREPLLSNEIPDPKQYIVIRGEKKLYQYKYKGWPPIEVNLAA